MTLEEIRNRFEFGRATNEVMMTYNFAIKLLAVAEAAEMTAPFCTEPYRGPPIEACGECHACVLVQALAALEADQ